MQQVLIHRVAESVNHNCRDQQRHEEVEVRVQQPDAKPSASRGIRAPRKGGSHRISISAKLIGLWIIAESYQPAAWFATELRASSANSVNPPTSSTPLAPLVSAQLASKCRLMSLSHSAIKSSSPGSST